jgi:hypothetical protein
MDAEALLDALDPEQREVALATRGPVCVLAGAGTGKTRAITHRIAYGVYTGVVDPAKALALTFTVRAAGELRGRLRELGVESVRASTFHAAALRQLTYFWPKVIGGRPPKLVESKIPVLRSSRCWPTPPPRSSGPRSARSARPTTPRSPRRPGAPRLAVLSRLDASLRHTRGFAASGS